MLNFIAWLKEVFSKGKVEHIGDDSQRFIFDFCMQQ